VSFLRKWFGREEPEDVPITLDLERRKEQLLRLERALDSLAAEMRADHTTNDPAWRERINEYSRLAGDAMAMRRGTPTRESVLDLVFAAHCSPDRFPTACRSAGRSRTRSWRPPMICVNCSPARRAESSLPARQAQDRGCRYHRRCPFWAG